VLRIKVEKALIGLKLLHLFCGLEMDTRIFDVVLGKKKNKKGKN
jgi:hypothetical protein